MGGGPAPRPRGAYATLLPSDLAYFRGVLDGDDGVKTDASSLEAANEDWTRQYRGRSAALLLPRTTRQVSLVLAHCHARRLAVVPQGGNTGLVGGAVPTHDEIVLGLSRMNKILSVDPDAGACVAEAGCVLEDLESALNARDMTVPLDLGAKGRCQIGGNVSTNAGGLRVVRHGSLRGTVLGLEAVLADGRVLDLLRTLRKDNTGYDLKQLFIGAEGTLGVVTKVAFAAPRMPSRVDVAFVAVESFADAVAAMRRAKATLGDVLSAFEFMDRASLELVVRTLKGAKDPFEKNPGFPFAFGFGFGREKKKASDSAREKKPPPMYVALETAALTGDGSRERRRLRAYCAHLKRAKLATEWVVAGDARAAARLWGLRERISVALKRAGAVYKYDLSLPTAEMYDLVDEMRLRVDEARARERAAEWETPRRTPRERGGGGGLIIRGGAPLDERGEKKKPFSFEKVRVLGYGHLGDGNLHLNVSSPDGYDASLEALIEPFVYEWTERRRGSVSAEHGVGAMKPGELARSKPRAAVALMREVKKTFDPRGIMNPYKVFPEEEAGEGAGGGGGGGDGGGGGGGEGGGGGGVAHRARL